MEEATVVVEEQAPSEAPEARPEGESPPEVGEETVSALRAALAEREAQLAALQGESARIHERLARITARYRGALLSANPELPAELVVGETPEEVELALEAARATVDQVRRHLAHSAHGGRVPVGAPTRGTPDLSALSPREKILYGLAQRG